MIIKSGSKRILREGASLRYHKQWFTAVAQRPPSLVMHDG